MLALPLTLGYGRCQKVAAQVRSPDAPATAERVDGLAATVQSTSHAGIWSRNLNAGVSAAGVHDSSAGWYAIVTPFASYDFSTRYSADVSISLYPYLYARKDATGPNAGTRLAFDGGDIGDTLLEAHAVFAPGNYQSLSTVSLTLPSGNHTDGLGTGRVTFSLDERIERYFGQTGLVLDVGGGDSSGLQNRLVTEDDTALGPLGLFQAGLVSWLPHTSMSIQSVAYEQLPIGDQKTYTTLMRPGFPNITVVSGRKVNEDNGFTTTLYVPLTSRLTLTGSYNRSLRLHLDTVSTGLTFVWKGTPLHKRESLIDRAMREAESTSDSRH